MLCIKDPQHVLRMAQNQKDVYETQLLRNEDSIESHFLCAVGHANKPVI